MEEFKRKIKLLDHIVYEVVQKENIPCSISTENFAEAHARTVARLSQSAKSFEEIVCETLSEEGFDKEKIGNFHKSITLGVAHHSIEQHGNVTLCFENTSMIATNKYCENKRLAAYLEKSTRYQDFSKPCFIVPKELDDKPELKKEYIETMNYLFEVYANILPKIIEEIKKEFAKKGMVVDEKSIKKKAFDSARYALPSSAYTNFAMTTNSQVFRSLVVDLLTNNIIEFNEIGEEMQRELEKVYPTLLEKTACIFSKKRENIKFTSNTITPLTYNSQKKIQINDSIFENIESQVKIIGHTDNAEKLIAYNYLLDNGFSVEYKDKEVYLNSKKLANEEISKYIKQAFNYDCTDYRSHRALELANYNFEGIIDFGAWRDLHRNRMLTWISSFISPEYGFAIPIFLPKDAEEEYLSGLKKAYAFWVKLLENGFNKEFCQYVCPLGTNAKILYTINAREMDHVSKTRTTAHAHFSYRVFVHYCVEEIKKINPDIGKNLKDYYDDPISSIH